uniref:Transmembrane protein adipocyte-associated 1 homolog n=1 Tax=Parascaris univalens TaxID=6257 RepID=A0A915BTL8_PARUN
MCRLKNCAIFKNQQLLILHVCASVYFRRTISSTLCYYFISFPLSTSLSLPTMQRKMYDICRMSGLMQKSSPRNAHGNDSARALFSTRQLALPNDLLAVCAELPPITLNCVHPCELHTHPAIVVFPLLIRSYLRTAHVCDSGRFRFANQI